MVNSVLARLPARDSAWLRSRAEPFKFVHGQFLCRQDQIPRYAYFPDHGVISVSRHTAEGQGIEMAVVGPGGVAGVESVLGAELSENELTVQSPGDGVRVKTSDLHSAFARRLAVRGILLDSLRAYLAQVELNVLCSRFHAVEQRLARKLLTLQFLSGIAEFTLTQEALCSILGASRPRVSEASKLFQSEGIVSADRGRIRIVDVRRLSRYSCDCLHPAAGVPPTPVRAETAEAVGHGIFRVPKNSRPAAL